MSSVTSAGDSKDLPAVLIVDDVDANLVAMRALLEGLPCNVTSVNSGNDALRALLRKEFAVILLDVQMPGMDGYEVATHARTNPTTKDVPIIFLTASHSSPENIARGYGSGAVDYLFKPLDSAVLRSKVRVFLELFQSRRELAQANERLELKNLELQARAATELAAAADLRQANLELQSAYRDLKSTQSQLVQSAKMASLGELVAGVAHEINNPLAFVLTHLETTRKNMHHFRAQIPDDAARQAEESWKRAQDRLNEINGGLQRIRELVLKLRTFSRLDEGERKIVSFRECIESVMTILQHKMKDGVEVAIELNEPDLIDCYPGLLNQLLLNLVVNALDAIEGGGIVSIRAGADGEMFLIAISDNGPGIAPELRERVLEPFFTTKPVGKGTGLGLSIAYSIAKKHGGTIDLTESSLGGACASLRIPLRLDT